MSPQSLVAIAALVLTVAGAISPALAQGQTSTVQNPSYSLPQRRPRIQVNPPPPLYRRCEVQYVVQYRPSGTVLFPAQHCWWVRG